MVFALSPSDKFLIHNISHLKTIVLCVAIILLHFKIHFCKTIKEIAVEKSLGFDLAKSHGFKRAWLVYLALCYHTGM